MVDSTALRNFWATVFFQFDHRILLIFTPYLALISPRITVSTQSSHPRGWNCWRNKTRRRIYKLWSIRWNYVRRDKTNPWDRNSIEVVMCYLLTSLLDYGPDMAFECSSVRLYVKWHDTISFNWLSPYSHYLSAWQHIGIVRRIEMSITLGNSNQPHYFYQRHRTLLPYCIFFHSNT